MEDVRPIVSSISHESFLKELFQVRPFIPVYMCISRRFPSILETVFSRESAHKQADEFVVEPWLEASNRHESAIFADIYIIERSTSVQHVVTSFSIKKMGM